MPRPDDASHRKLESDSVKTLQEMGFLMGDLTYHRCLSAELVERLRMMNAPAALAVRTRADRVAVHKTGEVCFFVEFKSNSGPRPNAAIEALPLAHHVRNGVPALFVYRNTQTGYECGFWASDLPRIFRLIIPNCGYTEEELSYFRKTFSQAFPNVNIVDGPRPGSNASGDPFVLMSLDALKAKAFDWRKVIGEWARTASEAAEKELAELLRRAEGGAA